MIGIVPKPRTSSFSGRMRSAFWFLVWFSTLTALTHVINQPPGHPDTWVQIKALLSMTNYLRSLLLFILVGLSVALPMLWYDNEARENSEPQLMYLRNIGPLSLLKRNIAIGRGDGLRPGK